MVPSSNSKSVYISEWAERHWIESIFAPQAQILQAITRSGRIASGFGDRREDALNRCLGETVEALASIHKNTEVFDGIAAWQEAEKARTGAFFEAVERVEITRWWAGDRAAQKVSPDWLSLHGFADWIARMRQCSYSRRETAVWRLVTDFEVEVMICKTNSPTGQDPVLGFGTAHCALEAVGHAMREAMLMEVNLIEILAVRGGFSRTDTAPVEERIADYARRCPDLLPSQQARMPDDPASRRLTTELEHIARFDGEVMKDDWQVWTCRLIDPEIRQMSPEGPFMNTPIDRGKR